MNPKLICLASMLLIVGLAASPAIAELIAYFPFEEGQGTTTVDATGNGNDGTLAAGVEWVQGYQGGGVQFDTANERIVIGPIDPSAGSNAMTLAAWINWQGQGPQHWSAGHHRQTSGLGSRHGCQMVLADQPGRRFLVSNRQCQWRRQWRYGVGQYTARALCG